MGSTAFDRIVDALNGHGCTVRTNGDGKAQAQCAAHDDRNPSLSITARNDGKGVLLHCHAGCDVADVVAELGLTMSDLFDDDGMRAAWNPHRDYTYPGGRRVHRKPNKEFPQSGNKADDSLFHADQIGDATTVYVSEGEKDVEVIEAVGGAAVCSAMGAGNAHLADWSPLKGKDVIIVADKDEPGRRHAIQVAGLLDGVAESIRTVEAKEGKDAADHIAAGHTLDELVITFDPSAGKTDNTSPTWQFVDGATFILDIPPTIPANWGDGQEVWWADGESLMIAGPMGLGKTTLGLRLLRARLGLGDGTLLGYSVTPCAGNILYLAMDRPAQIARAAYRMFTEDERGILRQRVKFWPGPPPYDVAKHPGILTTLAEAAGAAEVYLDSVKDAAIGLSEDEVGAGYNRARQQLLATGRQLAEMHHTTKRGQGGGPPTSVADIYGSAWITNGTGSIILLAGEPGDPIVGMRHVRAPADEVGPFQLLHDQAAGTLTVHHSADLVALARALGVDGLSVKDAAGALFSTSTPTDAQKEKARRKLAKLAADGLLQKVEGPADGRGGAAPCAWFPADRWAD